MAFLYRFLTNYELLLVIARFLFSLLLVLFAWQPGLRTIEPVMIAALAYYLASGTILGVYYRKAKKDWTLWHLFVYIDLVVVSVMVHTLGGVKSDVYYFYFQAMAMASFFMRWNRALLYTLLGNLFYIVTLATTLSDTQLAPVLLRVAVFLVTSLMFPLLAFLDAQRRRSFRETYRLTKEKEQLEQEMESYNRQVAEYTFDLHNLAVLDQLTKLHNHGYFHSRAVIEVEKSKQSGKPLSLVMMDIDNFKQVNDTYGHLVGDEVLIAIATRLNELLIGTYHMAFRTGGEELAVLLADTKLTEALAFAESIRDELSQVKVTLPGGRILHATVSVGVASFPEHGGNHQQIIDAADQAMYLAKESGKNCTCCYEQVQAEAMRERAL